VTRKLSCSDLGFACNAVFEAANDEELLELVRQHLLLEHPEEDLSDDERLRRLIRDA
jgi:predicted small metal-binding protein